jgi:hypothetical protein
MEKATKRVKIDETSEVEVVKEVIQDNKKTHKKPQISLEGIYPLYIFNFIF